MGCDFVDLLDDFLRPTCLSLCYTCSSRICYTRKHPCWVCRSDITNIEVDLDDINQIYVQDAKVTGCFSTTLVPMTVVAELKQGRRLDLHQTRQDGKPLPDNTCVKVYFTYCADAEEFVRAVEHQIQMLKPI